MLADRMEFQFPSNGKVYPKRDGQSCGTVQDRLRFNSLQTGKYIQSDVSIFKIFDRNFVSIPFKRESISKGARTLCRPNRSLRFNSLQTGKYIQSEIDVRSNADINIGFQFPSNGKVYPKEKKEAEKMKVISFNSLQTGKYIQSTEYRQTVDNDNNGFQFPSNGKVYPKVLVTLFFIFTNHDVSIPFKRESISKGKN